MERINEIIQHCEDEIRAGRADRVALQISRLNLAKIPRKARQQLANLCRRASLLNLGLKILAPLVRGDERATDAEKAEYAVLLQRGGSVREALALLREVDPKLAPEAQLFRAFCHFNRWEYAEAIPVLKSYLQADLAPYSALIGRVNLAAALLAVRDFDAARALLVQNLADAQRHGASRLEGNCRELHAQLLISSGQLTKAEEELERAAILFGSEKTLDQLFVRKWKAVLESESTKSLQPLAQFRHEAFIFGDMESVREADLHLLKVRFEEELYNHLYFGSPLSGYRARISKELSVHNVEATYFYGARDSKRVLEVNSGQVTGAELNAGKKIHQVLAALLRDFYRPLSLGALFAELFPDEYFNIYSSPSRVHQLLRRTREWILRAKLPISIVEENGTYRILVTGDFAFRIELSPEDTNRDVVHHVDRHSVALAKLRATARPSFRSSEACLILGMSATTFRRFADWAIANGYLKRLGDSRATCYQLCAPNLSVEEHRVSRAS